MLLCSEEDTPTDQQQPLPTEESDTTFHHLSLHALQGTQGAATIRFNGLIQGTNVHMDSGSSDNFIHPRIVQHLGIPIVHTTTIRVLGGTGKILSSNE